MSLLAVWKEKSLKIKFGFLILTSWWTIITISSSTTLSFLMKNSTISSESGKWEMNNWKSPLVLNMSFPSFKQPLIRLTNMSNIAWSLMILLVSKIDNQCLFCSIRMISLWFSFILFDDDDVNFVAVLHVEVLGSLVLVGSLPRRRRITSCPRSAAWWRSYCLALAVGAHFFICVKLFIVKKTSSSS